MSLEFLRRHRIPFGVSFLAAAVWLAGGVRRTVPSDGIAVLDSAILPVKPRVARAGWHLVPPGVLRLSFYPGEGATLSLLVGEDAPVVTREGTEVVARATLRYRVDADRVLEVHSSAGPARERDAIARWAEEGLRTEIGSSSYSDISGSRKEELRAALARHLDRRFRPAGLVLLSCDIEQVSIRAGFTSAAADTPCVPGMKVLLIGLDGADWNIIDPLIASGRVPNLARLARSGVRGRLRTITPMLSPVVWTSVATGVLPGRHGIIDFVASVDGEGEHVPVTSTLRKVKAIWNILGERGVEVGVVGWWATFPAEPVNGFVVTDRVAYQLSGPRLKVEATGEGMVHPPDAGGLVASLRVRPETIRRRELLRYIRLGSVDGPLSPDEARLVDEFKTVLAGGDTYARAAVALAKRFEPRFLAFYLEGTDTVAHLFMPYAPPALEGIGRRAARLFGSTVERYYRHADAIVGRLVEEAGPDTAVIVCSDHGFRTGENRPLTDSRIGFGQAADWHRKYGIVILHGPPFRSGHRLREASVLDITPTVLALYGLPVAEDMDGRPIMEAFSSDFLDRHPVAYRETYEGGATAAIRTDDGRAAGPIPRDPEGERRIREKLQSLGYLRQDTANSHNNRGILHLRMGRYEEAIGEFERAIERSEDLAIARINIARARLAMKQYDAAASVLGELLESSPRSKEAENLLGTIRMEQGRLQEAKAHFERALRYEPNFTEAHNSLGLLYDRLGRTDEALRLFRRAVEVDPDYAEPYNNIGLIHKREGRPDEAIAAFRRAIEADPEFAGSYSNLALMYEEKGDLEKAERQFRNALRRDANNADVRSNYGGLLYMLGRLQEARRELERTIELDPSHASAHNNLGAVYGRLGLAEEEIAAYRKAVQLDPGYADAYHNLGLALLKRGSAEEGESALRRAVEVDPGYARGYAALGRALMARGETTGAIELLSRGCAAAPGSAELQALLGEALIRAGDLQGGLAAMRRSLEIEPEQPRLRRRLEELREESPG
ncbi:MAG: tetratricopeptide repeat protein [Acidobacteriota bacterium]